MANDAQILRFRVFKNGSAVLMARVVGSDGGYLAQADCSAIEYTIWLLNDHDPNEEVAVEGHDAVELAVAGVVYDTLQTADPWDKDTIGYNFKHEIDISEYQAFALRGRRYLVVVKITPTSGQPILLEFGPSTI
jgi:hypothetical protein